MNIVFRKLIWLVMLIPVIYLAFTWNRIPQIVPMHFNFKGTVDKYAGKQDLLILTLIITIINMLIHLLIMNIYKIDPRKTASLNKDRLKKIAFDVSLYMSAIGVMLIYVISNNNPGVTPKFVLIGMGLLVALIGNNIYNIKPNYFAGIRLPWTLENEDNWKQTHHFAGRLWFFGGLIFAIITFFISNRFVGYVGIGLLMILILLPIFYSYNIYKNHKRLKA